MKKSLLFKTDVLRKEELASLHGGNGPSKGTCACICLGPIYPAEPFSGSDSDSISIDNAMGSALKGPSTDTEPSQP